MYSKPCGRSEIIYNSQEVRDHSHIGNLILIECDGMFAHQNEPMISQLEKKSKQAGRYVKHYNISGHYGGASHINSAGKRASIQSAPYIDRLDTVVVDLDGIDRYVAGFSTWRQRLSRQMTLIKLLNVIEEEAARVIYIGTQAFALGKLSSLYFWKHPLRALKSIFTPRPTGFQSPLELNHLSPNAVQWHLDNLDVPNDVYSEYNKIIEIARQIDFVKFAPETQNALSHHQRHDLLNGLYDWFEKYHPPAPLANSQQFLRPETIVAYLAKFGALPRVINDDTEKWLCSSITPGSPNRICLILALVLRLSDVDHKEFWNDPNLIDVLLEQFSTSDLLLKRTTTHGTSKITSNHNIQTGLAQNYDFVSDICSASETHLKKDIHIHLERIERWPIELRQSGNAHAHIGFAVFEHNQIGHKETEALKAVDLIFTPSHFVSEVISKASPSCKIRYLGKPIIRRPQQLMPLPIFALRSYMLCAFDAHSGAERKNPLATVEAFLKFPKQDRIHLVIKTTQIGIEHWGDPNKQLAALRKLARQEPDITLIEEDIDINALHSLIANARVFVSSHRSEGFGYLPAYAMAYGVPVIATDYSGTQDFVTSKTAWPVACRQVPMHEKFLPADATSSTWAEIDIDALFNAMAEVLSNTKLAQAKSKLGQKLMASEFSRKAVYERFTKSLRELNCLETEPI